MKTQRKYRVAAISFEPVHGAKDRNLAKLTELAREAAVGGAKILVMPEMATIGIFWRDRRDITLHVEPIPGPSTEYFIDLAKELDVLIAVGLAEVDLKTDIYYNAAILVGPEGLIGHHRKVHGYLSDPLWAADGDLGFQVWDTPLGRLGMLICMDANYPESGRLLAQQGAVVFLMPMSWTEEICPAPLWIIRAFENGVSAICANRWGEERGIQFSGGSTVLAADGSIQRYLTTGDGIVFGEIDLDDERRGGFAFDPAIHPIESRRPELYEELTLNRYSWATEPMYDLFGDGALPEGTRFEVVAWEFTTSAQGIELRLNQLDAWLASSGDDASDLIVLPELSFIGPLPSPEAVRAAAESIPGPIISQLEGWCAKRNRFLVAGLIECEDDQLYNTIVLVGPEGLCARYRKTHLSGAEALWAKPGNSLVRCDTPLGRIGLLAGTDMLLPEPVRCLALDGVDVVCVSAALTGPEAIRLPHELDNGIDRVHWNLFRTRAAENNVYVAAANWSIGSGEQRHMGNSGVFFGPILFGDPAIEALPMEWAGDDKLALMTVDTRSNNDKPGGNPVRTKPALRRRLPGWYKSLVVNDSMKSDALK